MFAFWWHLWEDYTTQLEQFFRIGGRMGGRSCGPAALSLSVSHKPEAESQREAWLTGLTKWERTTLNSLSPRDPSSPSPSSFQIPPTKQHTAPKVVITWLTFPDQATFCARLMQYPTHYFREQFFLNCIFISIHFLWTEHKKTIVNPISLSHISC